MKSEEEWTDDGFLGYVDLHCRTERALFHRKHVLRLYKMAHAEAPDLGMGSWFAMYQDVADPLIKKARGRMHLKLVP